MFALRHRNARIDAKNGDARATCIARHMRFG